MRAILDLPEARDRIARWTVEEYWIVLPEPRQVEVYREPREGVYAVQFVREAPAVLECASVPAVKVDLGELFPSS